MHNPAGIRVQDPQLNKKGRSSERPFKYLFKAYYLLPKPTGLPTRVIAQRKPK
jgi:hypothetical protein